MLALCALLSAAGVVVSVSVCFCFRFRCRNGALDQLSASPKLAPPLAR